MTGKAKPVPASKPPTINVDLRDDKTRYTGMARKVSGSMSNDFGNMLVNQVFKSQWGGGGALDEVYLHNALGALRGIEPRDEIEGMIASQMFATHCAAMECFRRAMIGEQTLPGREHCLSQANKLTRSYATLVQALDKHRGKGNQTVRVEHVHVYEGGQAIVGNVPHGEAGAKNLTKPDTVPAIEQRQDEALVEDLVCTREGVGVEA